jgi:capsid protein
VKNGSALSGFKALIYRAQSLDLITQEQAKSGFTNLNRKGFTRREDVDDRLEMESPRLVQRATDLLDHASWRKALKACGLSHGIVEQRFMLSPPPRAPL